MSQYPLFWRVHLIRPEWFGRRCRIVIHGKRGRWRPVERESAHA